MKRCVRLDVRLVAVSLVLLAGVGARGQTQDPKTVRIDTLGVMDTLYHLSGGGANSLALIDEINGGVVLIDTKPPGWGQPVRDALDGVTDLPVTTIINTHAHPDHAGSNGEFGDAALIVAHENTRANMARMDLYSGTNAASLPTKTFADRFSLLEDIDRIELYHFGAAHTDGDVLVVFPAKGVAYMGGLFPSKATPVIDTRNGGSGVAFPETLAKAVAGITGVRLVVTGHGEPPVTYAGRGRRETGANRPWTGFMTWEDLEEYADFNRDFLAATRRAFRAGLSVEEAAAALELPERYEDYGMEHARANIEAIYDELANR
ncbi:MAG: MBL fold metallo-hydrolase [Acidobacteriota bacterium]|nr:MBL fold metallo-hydrolase [Acidobacteriota bacterium]